jgi:PhnB protein
MTQHFAFGNDRQRRSIMQAQPYLMFNGRCDEAIAFYQAALGADVVMRMLFKESPDQRMITPGMGEKVMHATLRIGDTTVFLSDGRCDASMKFEGFVMSLTVATDAEAEDRFAKLTADGGKAQTPLSKTFWTSKFGMLTDKFGVGWMVMVGP